MIRGVRFKIFAALLVGAALGLGCQTTGSDAPKTAEEIVKNRFRARWWNYYDRALAYQQLGEWELAEKDLRAALAKRSGDQRWARTYGLHFKPEYFPKRELGFVLYKQGRTQEALRLLDRSISELFTARAAHYIDECRALTVAGTDSEPPRIELIASTDDGAVASLTLNTRVRVSDDTFVRNVWVNGEPARSLRISSAEQVDIPVVLAMRPGENRVEIRAEDIAGNISTEVLTFDTDVDGPAVSFDAPIVLPGTISGLAYDPAGVERFELAGKAVALDLQPDGTARFTLALTESDVDGPLRFRAEDRYGNVTSDTVALDGLVRNGRGLQFAARRLVRLPAHVHEFPLPGGGVAYINVAQATGDDPDIDYTDLEDGRRYPRDEIPVRVRVSAAAPIASIVINDTPMQSVIPGESIQRVSRREPLDPGENVISVSVTDSENRTAEKSIVIVREDNELEGPQGSLGLAVMESAWKPQDGSDPLDASVVSNVFYTLLQEDYEERFNTLQRDELQRILLEQELSGLSPQDDRLRTNMIDSADLLLSSRYRVVDQHIGITLTLTDTETGIADEVDAFGVLSTGSQSELEEVLRDLAAALTLRYPRVSAEAQLGSDGSRVLWNVTALDGIRGRHKCVVYYLRAEEAFGAVEYLPTVLGVGRVTGVGENFSEVEPSDPLSVEGEFLDRLYVVTK